MTDGIHEWSAAYVVGALDDTDRETFELHLRDCARCQADVVDFVPLPALVRLVDLPDVEAGTIDVSEAVIAGVRRDRTLELRRRERWLMATAAVAVVVACGAIVAAIVLSRDTEPAFGGPPVELVLDESGGITGRVTTSERGWGTRVEIDLFDVPERDRYLLWAVGLDGTWDVSASWGASPEGTCRVVGATRLYPDQIVRFVVTSADKDDELVSAFST